MANLVMTKTPLRITFAGGGTDLPGYYENHGTGAVVSAAITKYIYITTSNHFHKDEIRVSYSKTENSIKSIDEIQHPSVREALRFLDISTGLQITSITEVPSQGTGLGSSSSFLVGLLNALHVWKGRSVGPKRLAEEAIHIEREVLREAGGRQDQYMAALGGIQLMEFHKGGAVTSKPLYLSKASRENLESHMLMLYTNVQRASSTIHENQSAQMDRHTETYHKMRYLAYAAQRCIEEGDIKGLGSIMHENWVLKKSLATGISDGKIDQWYSKAMDAGAMGGKILGAGGGGFMLLLAEPSKHEGILSALGSGLKREDFKIEQSGSRVIHVED